MRYLEEWLLREKAGLLMRDMMAYAWKMHLLLLTLERKVGFNIDQPRVPAGDTNGGQWTSGGGGGGDIYADAINPVYPVEGVLGAIAGLVTAGLEAVVFAVEAMEEGVVGEIDGGLRGIAQSIEDWLGGSATIGRNKAGDPYMMNDGKKIRFDINKPGTLNGVPDDPHFHFEIENELGKWIDAGPGHRYYFKK